MTGGRTAEEASSAGDWISVEFGWLPRPLRLSTARVTVVSLSDFESRVGVVRAWPECGKRWIYPGIEDDPTEDCRKPRGRFELPTTHRLSLCPDLVAGGPDLSSFIIQCIALLCGMQLRPAGHGHLSRTACRPGELVDFFCSDRELQRSLDFSIDRWLTLSASQRGPLIAGLHWYLSAASHERQHEEFGALYTSLDALYRSACRQGMPQSATHRDRIVSLSRHYGVPLSEHFGNQSNPEPDVSQLTRLRNAFIHEALWEDEPIGFTVTEKGHEITLSLGNFVSRLLVAMLGIECAYSSSALDTRQTHFLDLRKEQANE